MSTAVCFLVPVNVHLSFFFSRNVNGDNCTRMEETEASEKHSRAVLLLLQTYKQTKLYVAKCVHTKQNTWHSVGSLCGVLLWWRNAVSDVGSDIIASKVQILRLKHSESSGILFSRSLSLFFFYNISFNSLKCRAFLEQENVMNKK